MKQPVSRALRGSCLCGGIAFEIDGRVLRLVNCHCPSCRRASSAAYASNLFLEPARFRWLRGESEVASFRAPDAHFQGTVFCRRCGSDLPLVSEGGRLLVVPAGSLDSDPGVKPTAHACVESKASWFEITDDLPQFHGMPPRI